MHSCSIRNGTGNRRQTRVPDKAGRWILSITPGRLPHNPRFCEEYTLFLPGNLLTVTGRKGAPFEGTLQNSPRGRKIERALRPLDLISGPGGGCPRENGTFALLKFCCVAAHRNRYPARMNTDYADLLWTPGYWTGCGSRLRDHGTSIPAVLPDAGRRSGITREL